MNPQNISSHLAKFKFKDWLVFWRSEPTPTAYQEKLAAVFAWKQCSIFKQTKHMPLKVINVLWNSMCLAKQTDSHLPLWPPQKEKQNTCFRYSRQNNATEKLKITHICTTLFRSQSYYFNFEHFETMQARLVKEA